LVAFHLGFSFQIVSPNPNRHQRSFLSLLPPPSLTNMGCGSSKPLKLVVVGLDNSGKSTLVNHLRPEKKSDIQATVGFEIDSFSLAALGGIRCTMFDMSGSEKYRNLWEHYYKECNGMVFVIDSSDEKRLSIVRDEISQLLIHKDIVSNPIPILFFANKMDLPQARTFGEISSALKLVN
jgi:ADP-ribosylation factor-like protein 6